MERSHFASDDQVVAGLDRGEVQGEIFDAGQSLFLLIAARSPVLGDEFVIEAEPRVLVAFVGAMNLLDKASRVGLYLGHRNSQTAIVGRLLSGLKHGQGVAKTSNVLCLYTAFYLPFVNRFCKFLEGVRVEARFSLGS